VIRETFSIYIVPEKCRNNLNYPERPRHFDARTWECISEHYSEHSAQMAFCYLQEDRPELREPNALACHAYRQREFQYRVVQLKSIFIAWRNLA